MSLESTQRRPLRCASQAARAASLLFLLGAAGCAVGPNYQTPDLEPPPAFANASDPAPPSSDPAPEQWWLTFNSEALTALIEQANANNHNLQAAFAAVTASRAAVGRSRAGLFPGLDAGASAETRDESEAVGAPGFSAADERYEASLSVAWELDLFGRVRRSIRAAQADAEAEEALYQEILLALQADVTARYFSVSALQSEIELVSRGVETRREAAQLVQERFNAGTVSELDVAQAASSLAEAESRYYALRRSQNSERYALAVLVGETPATFTFEPSPLHGLLPAVPAGLPSELLTRRPDVRRAERALAAASERIGVARASFFPRLSLGAAFGFAAADVDALFDDSSEFSSASGSLVAPLFQAGRLRANEREARAVYEQRWHGFKQIALEAISEVDDLLQSLALLQAQREASDRGVQAAERAREIALAQYERGLIDFVSVLDAERTALDAEQQLEQLRGVEFTTSVNLIRALGGSW